MKTRNWFTWLKKAMKKEPSERECDRADQAAGNWTTCASSNFCRRLPRTSDGEPIDSILSSLGMKFWWRIRHRNWKGAITNLQAIESRSHYLLSQLRKEHKPHARKTRNLKHRRRAHRNCR